MKKHKANLQLEMRRYDCQPPIKLNETDQLQKYNVFMMLDVSIELAPRL